MYSSHDIKYVCSAYINICRTLSLCHFYDHLILSYPSFTFFCCKHKKLSYQSDKLITIRRYGYLCEK